MKLLVNQHTIQIEKVPINEREIDITKCEFEFVDEITNEYVKEAYFTLNGQSYKQIIVNDQCDIPNEVLAKKGRIELGVVAYLVENEEEIKRYNPSPVYFNTWLGSLKDNAKNSEPITPSEMEQFEQALQDGLEEVNSKLDDIDEAITEVNNLDLDVDKVGKVTTISLTKKDGTTKQEQVTDGFSLNYDWEGTSLGVKREDEQEYVYTDLKGEKGDCNFATFEINNDMELVMNKTDDMLLDFELSEDGILSVVI